MRWYVRITTPHGSFVLNSAGYKTKHEAEELAELARKVSKTVSAEVEQW